MNYYIEWFGRRGGGSVVLLFVWGFFKCGICLVLGRMSEDTEEILPCFNIRNSQLISEIEDGRILKVFKLDNPVSHESDLLIQ